MDARRIFLYLALGLILLLIWTSWRGEHAPPPPGTPPASSAATVQSATPGKAAVAAETGTARSLTVPVATAAGAAFAHPSRLAVPGGSRIMVRTDVLALTIALRGATLTRADLLKYPKALHSKTPVALLSAKPKDFLSVSPLLASKTLPDALDYQAAAKNYRLAPGEKTLVVPLVWKGKGVTVKRVLTFTRGSYAVKVKTEIVNTGGASEHFTAGLRLLGRNPVVSEHFWEHFLPKYWAYRGPAYYDGDYNKRQAQSLPGNPLDKVFSGGWIASVKQYFVAAAVPAAKHKAHYFGRAVGDNGYAVGYHLPGFELAAGHSETRQMTLFLGPKLQGHLDAVAPGLSRTVDYGKATIICVPIFWFLSHIHGLLGNWGWSIIILVLIIKAIFYFPQRMSARSMAKMRKLQPRLALLKERYKDDKQKLSQATMELYRKEGANPVSGCLPMLIQIPIFIGLFYVLIDSVELRQAPWVLWIQDLSAPDPLYILPILYGLSALVQFRLQPQAADNAQAKMMMFMPLLFMFFYAIFPSGLVLYYLLNTLLNIAIQWQVNHELGMPLNLWPKKKKKPASPQSPD